MNPHSNNTEGGNKRSTTKVLTIMFTDLKGYSQLTSSFSRDQFDDMLQLHEEILRPIFQKFHGVIIKTIGDAFFTSFESPTNAVLCGMYIQHAIRQHNENARKQPFYSSVTNLFFGKRNTPQKQYQFNVRIGINSGEVHVRDEDVFGEHVNIAARVESIAKPGRVYFTESTYLAMNKNEIQIESIGPHELKGIPVPIEIYEARAVNLSKVQKSQAIALTRAAKKDETEKIQQGNTQPALVNVFNWAYTFTIVVLCYILASLFISPELIAPVDAVIRLVGLK